MISECNPERSPHFFHNTGIVHVCQYNIWLADVFYHKMCLSITRIINTLINLLILSQRSKIRGNKIMSENYLHFFYHIHMTSALIFSSVASDNIQI